MTEIAKSRAPKILDRQFGLVEFKFRRWSAELTEEQTLEIALDPTFWAGQVDKIMGHDKSKGRGDIIEIRKADISLYAELLIVEIGAGFVKTVLISEAKPESIEIPASSPLATKWNVGKRCHEVVRVADNQVMHSGFQTKTSAAAWIDDHLKKMAT